MVLGLSKLILYFDRKSLFIPPVHYRWVGVGTYSHAILQCQKKITNRLARFYSILLCGIHKQCSEHASNMWRRELLWIKLFIKNSTWKVTMVVISFTYRVIVKDYLLPARRAVPNRHVRRSKGDWSGCWTSMANHWMTLWGM